MERKLACAVSVLAALLFCGDAAARTWWVLKDGTGDFTVIQEAVDAAASGDTIRIGPGRFNEGQVYSNPGWTRYVRVIVTKSELTLIGSGDETIIGQETPWDLSQGEHMGLVAGAYYGNQLITIADITFENMGTGIYTDEVDVFLRNCVFQRNWKSVVLLDFTASTSVLIEDCRFEYCARDGYHVVPGYQTEFVMRQCTLVLRPFIAGDWLQGHVNLTGIANGLIEHCQFIGGGGGVMVGIWGSSLVRDCTFDGQYIFGATASRGTALTVERCRFRDQKRIFDLLHSSAVQVMRDCVIENVTEFVCRIGFAESVIVNDCDLAHGDNGTVYVLPQAPPYQPPTTLDFINNYWGTDDPDSIAAWIHDWHDDPTAPFIVQYEPYRVHSTPVRQESLGGIKNLFRSKRK